MRVLLYIISIQQQKAHVRKLLFHVCCRLMHQFPYHYHLLVMAEDLFNSISQSQTLYYTLILLYYQIFFLLVLMLAFLFIYSLNNSILNFKLPTNLKHIICILHHYCHIFLLILYLSSDSWTLL